MRETRQCAIAFADLASSTRMYRVLGDSAARELTQGFYARVVVVLAQFQGRLVKTLGDGVMCAFPGAEATVRAMIALHAEMEAAHSNEHPLKVHSGISAGPVIAEGTDVFGTVVNIAAYLAALARTGQILATQAALEQLPQPLRACCRAIYNTRLKGDDRESLVHEVQWQTDRAEITNVNLGLGRLPTDEGALMIVSGEETLRVTAFQPRVGLGRAQDNDLVVADEFVSRHHAMIELDALRFKLIDASANGTFVAFDGAPGEVRVVRGETVLHGSGRISLGRSLSDPLAVALAFKRDQRALYRV